MSDANVISARGMWLITDTKYNRKQKCHTLYSWNTHKNIFGLKSAEK